MSKPRRNPQKKKRKTQYSKPAPVHNSSQNTHHTRVIRRVNTAEDINKLAIEIFDSLYYCVGKE